MVLNVLLKAAIERQSIEAVCADMEDVVDSNTLREALNKALTVEELRQHEAEFNEAWLSVCRARCPEVGWRWQSTCTTSHFTARARSCEPIPCVGKPVRAPRTSGASPPCM